MTLVAIFQPILWGLFMLGSLIDSIKKQSYDIYTKQLFGVKDNVNYV